MPLAPLRFQRKEMLMETEEIIETALGDLIVALTEEAMPFVHDQKEATKWRPSRSHIF